MTKLEPKSTHMYFSQFPSKKCFLFVPLHSSPGGKKFGKFIGADVNTTAESNKIVRLPLFDSLSDDQVDYVCENIMRFYNEC